MKMNQTQMILKHLQKNKGITSMEAISEYGITRLASRIHELRESGHNIQNFWEESVNRYGVKVKYVRYVLIKEKQTKIAKQYKKTADMVCENLLDVYKNEPKIYKLLKKEIKTTQKDLLPDDTGWKKAYNKMMKWFK
jgi:coenzyme F420-reducing hydrogenase alpha subunit